MTNAPLLEIRIDALRRPEITFRTTWRGVELVGCAALKQLGPTHGEIRSMRREAHRRGIGVGRAMRVHVVAQAQARGHLRLSLETGSTPEFEPARQLYARGGFELCGPFADDRDDPHCVSMPRWLPGFIAPPMRRPPQETDGH